MRYATRYMNKITRKTTDGPVVVLDQPPASNTECGRMLRRNGLLARGEHVRAFHVEPDGRIVAFPAGSAWQSILLSPLSA